MTCVASKFKVKPVSMVSRYWVWAVTGMVLCGTVPECAVYEVEDIARYERARTGGNYMYNFYLPPPGGSQPWWPSWSPDGLQLAFSMHGSIWLTDVGSGAAHEIAHAGEYLSSPEFAPDGRHLAFTADDGRAINLRLLNLETGAVRPITDDDQVNVDPAFSPDGTRLAYVSTRPNGYFNVFVISLEDTTAIQVTHDNPFGRDRLYFGDYDLHIQPAWEPGGDTLLVLSNRGIPLGSGGLWRVPVQENAMEHATLIHKEETLYRTRADIAPDGTRLVYSAHLGGQFNNLFVLPIKGGEPYKLTFGEWDSFHPRFSPDGHQIAYVSNQGGLPHLRLLQTFGGRDTVIRLDTLHWMTPAGHLAVRVQSAETGRVLPARVYLHQEYDDRIKAFAPADAYHRQGRLAEHFFHTDGAFATELPAGEWTIGAMHGFEHVPAAVSVVVAGGDTARATLTLERMADLEAGGWYSGSNHVHMNYGGNLHNTPENLVFMARAEHLHVIGELVANKDNRILDYQFFTGAPDEGPDYVLYFNEEYRPPFYGHISLINLTEHLISPFTTGYEGTAIESLYPSNTQIFRLAREQGALGAYVHPFWGDEDPLEADLGVAKAFPVDLALGTLDYHELVSGAGWAAYDVWHHALNNGFRITAVGGEDAISNLHRTAIIGQMRAYARMPEGLSWDGWLSAIRRGEMFVTNGPLLTFSVNGAGIGSTVSLPAEGGVVTVSGTVKAFAPIEAPQLLIGGRVVSLEAELEAAYDREDDGDYLSVVFERELPISRSGWVTLQAFSNEAYHPIDDRFLQATTNPVWVIVGDQPVRSSTSADYFIRWIDKLAGMAEAHPGWRTDQEKAHVLGEFQEAREVYERLIDEASAAGR